MVARFYRDIDLTLLEDESTNDIRSFDDTDAVKVSVINLVLTAKGQKLFQLPKGTNIEKLLFDDMNQAILFRLEKQIRYVIENYEPRVDNIQVHVFGYEQHNLVTATIYFRIIGSTQTVSVSLPLITTR